MNRFFKSHIVFFLCLFSVVASAQENPFNKLEIGSILSSPPKQQKAIPSANIKGIQNFTNQSGIVFTKDALFKTSDGENWREIVLPKSRSENISAVLFKNENVAIVILPESNSARIWICKTFDGGISWNKLPVNITDENLLEADLENGQIEMSNDEQITLTFRLPTSSNFSGKVSYVSNDGGQNWQFENRSVEIKTEDSAIEEIISGNWKLKSVGDCANGKNGCVLESKVFFADKEITPTQIKSLAQAEKQNAMLSSRNSVFAAPPNGSTRISLNRGFDKCTAAPAAQMQTWWDNSPFYDSNIYISGRNRGCTQALLTATWVKQVSAMGWGFIPTIVGYQAPCSVSTNSAKHSSDPATAETQGRGEADIAITDANNLGLTQGTVLYYDMERYDETTSTPNCRASVNAFLKGWTDRLHEQGYISGVYGSPFNAQADWINIPPASRMDAVWLARWNNVMSVWGVAPLPDTFWTNHQRIHQWLGPRNETWGGVTFNIDNNISDAPVAAPAIAKNKPADFDGDGRTDISLFRPDNGVWYVANSSNSSYTYAGFGLGTDVLAPGDYDGDGKTDFAVYRPAESVWHFLTKANTYSSKQFGASGDVPVAADFNGDGKTDIALFRPSNGVWYIASSDSLGTFTYVQFGQDGDKPVQADYDGDGKTDLAVFRPSTGAWYVLRSSDGGFAATAFGISTDKPVQGDYDGDGKTDFGVFRNGIWYLQQTTAGSLTLQFGVESDIPMTGDFDGDGKYDIAVFRPSNGGWYLLQSQNGFLGVSFGLSGDKPIPNAYLPR